MTDTTTPIDRAQEVIVARIQAIIDARSDPFGVEVNELLSALDFEHARPFLKDDATEADWAEVGAFRTRADVVAAIIDYLPFAYEKAENERGLSASRSISHMQGWAWLLGDEEFARLVAADYAPYGIPQLAVMADLVGLLER